MRSLHRAGESPIVSTAMRRLDRSPAIALAACALICAAAAMLSAPPMPNTEIAVSLDDGGVRLDIVMPFPELLLALPASFPSDGNLLDDAQQRALRAYFDEHLAIVSQNDIPQPHVIESLSIRQAVDANVGWYQE